MSVSKIQVPETDQWLLKGNCKKCRRDKYCTKACKAHKEATQRTINQVLDKYLGDVFDVFKRG